MRFVFPSSVLISTTVVLAYWTATPANASTTINPFVSKDELKQAVNEYCNNPGEWTNNDKFNKYG
jgi:hypothetical protein